MEQFDSLQAALQEEAQARWGGTAAYAEFEARDPAARSAATAGMERLMDAFAACMQTGAAPASAEAQALVDALQAYITAHFYTCTEDILAGLGQMYTADARFQQNLDRRAPGTAAFISAAIGYRGKTA